ncbi:MAG: homoserine kinase [Proteobacteria bacterium]|nr:homoserine kinase [Pseudomonadota bacterium]
MAVYTHVTADEVSDYLKSYALGTYRAHEGITQGVENTNYHLHTSSGRYILTIFEKRIRREDLPFVFGFTAHLKASGINVPDAYSDKTGNIIGTLGGKPAAVIRYLDGAGVKDQDITPDHCAQLGETLARMHLSAQSFAGGRENPVNHTVWKKLLKEALPKTEILDEASQQAIEKTFKDYLAIEQSSLPFAAIHADAFPDNVFFEGPRLSGVIDFYFACTDTFAYDAAMTLNAWCFTTDGVLVPQRLEAFTNAYESVRPLMQVEKDAFGALRRAAALRILSTRLYDWVFTPTDANVVKKDPIEYLKKLKADVTWP